MEAQLVYPIAVEFDECSLTGGEVPIMYMGRDSFVAPAPLAEPEPLLELLLELDCVGVPC
jgi:hypothetical protein